MAHTSSSIAPSPAVQALPTHAVPAPPLPLPAWQISYGSQPPMPDPSAAEPWQRPVDWLPLPAIQPGEQKLVGLFAVYPGEGNVLAVRAAGNYTVDWGDGTVEHVTSPAETIRRHQEWFGNSLYGPSDRFWITAASNTSWQQRIEGTFLVYCNGNRLSASEYRLEENNGNVELVLTTPLPNGAYSYFYGSWSWGETVIEPIKAEHRYSYNTVSAASRCSRGYRQVIVTITPQPGANLTVVDLSPRHSSISQDDASTPWLDLALSLPRAEGGASIVFCGCERYSTYDYLGSVERITIHDAGGASNFGWLLYYAGALRVFQLHRAEALEEMDGMCCYCYALEQVQLPPLPHVTTASEAFYECTSLRQLNLEGMASLSDASYLVYGCNLLKQLRLAGITSLTSLEWACQEAPELERVWIEDAEALQSTAYLFSNCRSLREVVIGGAERIEQMGGMFQSCSALEIAPELPTTEVVDMHEMFASCTSLRQVPHYDTGNVTTMESMFSGCQALETIPPFDTRKVTTMRWMFASCTALSRLPRLNLRALETMEGMFNGCYALISLPLLNTEAMQNMTYTFSGCYGLINLPALPVGNVSNFYGVFSNCVGLASAPLQGIAATISFWGCALSKPAILTIFQNLAYVGSNQSIDIGSNSGTNELSTYDLAVATSRGWTVLY